MAPSIKESLVSCKVLFQKARFAEKKSTQKQMSTPANFVRGPRKGTNNSIMLWRRYGQARLVIDLCGHRCRHEEEKETSRDGANYYKSRARAELPGSHSTGMLHVK